MSEARPRGRRGGPRAASSGAADPADPTVDTDADVDCAVACGAGSSSSASPSAWSSPTRRRRRSSTRVRAGLGARARSPGLRPADRGHRRPRAHRQVVQRRRHLRPVRRRGADPRPRQPRRHRHPRRRPGAQRPASSWLTTVALGLLLGGAIGNLIDRIRFGYVIDWVDMGIGSWRFYTFNVADSAISIAIVLLLAAAIFGRPPAAEAGR